MKPNVIIAGFPRTGSTHLYWVLKQHPEIDVGKIKEPSYFTKTHFFLDYPKISSPSAKKDFSWYENLWSNKNIRIDFSIDTSYSPLSIKSIKEKIGDPKIIFLIRDQDSHEKSLFNLLRNNSSLKIKDFNDYKEMHHPFLRYSDFENYINNYKRNFSNIKIFNIVDNDTEKEVKKILKFSGVKDINFKFDFNVEKLKGDYSERGKVGPFFRFRRKILMAFPFLNKIEHYPSKNPSILRRFF